MKTLIYELFSGVGVSNQLFSLETAIYLSNIMNRKLILIIRHPLCHCGRTSWDYGKFLDFFSDNYKQYLQNGLEVHYGNIPSNISNIISSKDCVTINFPRKFSQIVIIDKHLYTDENKEAIKTFRHFRDEFVIDFNSYDQEYIYINKSNASRCFYNFYTTQDNYILMSKICESLTHLHESFNIIDLNIDYKYIFVHLRLGDVKHNKNHIDNNSMQYYDHLKNTINNIYSHKENKDKKLVIMADRSEGSILNKLNDAFGIVRTEELLKNIEYKKYFKNARRFEIIDFLIQRQISYNADYFIGCEGSTVSNYIQYINYLNNKSYNLYVSKELELNDKRPSWTNKNGCGAAGIGWKMFFPENIVKKPNLKLITLTNDGYKDMTTNLLLSMKKLGIEKKLKIYCIGTECFNFFKTNYPFNEIIQIDVEGDYLKTWVEYKSIQNPDMNGKKKWATITSYKIYCMNNELVNGNDIIFTDGDIVFEKNPFQYLIDQINDHDLLIQNDNQSYSNHAFCTGFFYMKSNDKTKEITNFKSVQENIDTFQNDQQYLRRFERQLDVKYLPLELFPNGKYWRTKLPKSPYIIHFNYDTSIHKIKRMKTYHKWYIDTGLNCEKNFNYNDYFSFTTKVSFQNWIDQDLNVQDVIINSSIKDASDSFVEHPIGVQHDYLKYYFADNNNEFLKHSKRNTEVCLCSMNTGTDIARRVKNKVTRRSILNTVNNMKFVCNFRSNPVSYFKEIGKYKFVICPEGNGIDTHRLWETLYSKGIPIVERNDRMEKKLEGLPILWTTDYSELTEEYLNLKYTEILNNSYNFKKLYISSYNEIDRKDLFDKSKFWCNKRELGNFFNRYYNIHDINNRYNHVNHSQIQNIYFALKDCNGVTLDKKLDDLFKRKEKGVFIDVGANDGINQSNTLYLEKTRKWNGILITPNKDKHKECIKNRPNSICENYACVSPDYKKTTCVGDFWRINGSIDCYRSKSHNKETVNCCTLDYLLNKNIERFQKQFGKYLKTDIDLLKIDTCAFVYEVLKGIDLNKYQPTYILIEILTQDYDKICEYLSKNQYTLESNFTNYNKKQNRRWDGSHNDYLFKRIFTENINLSIKEIQ